MSDEEEWICGESYDHTLETTYEDEELVQYRCAECGAEIDEDKE